VSFLSATIFTGGVNSIWRGRYFSECEKSPKSLQFQREWE